MKRIIAIILALIILIPNSFAMEDPHISDAISSMIRAYFSAFVNVNQPEEHKIKSVLINDDYVSYEIAVSLQIDDTTIEDYSYYIRFFTLDDNYSIINRIWIVLPSNRGNTSRAEIFCNILMCSASIKMLDGDTEEMNKSNEYLQGYWDGSGLYGVYEYTNEYGDILSMTYNDQRRWVSITIDPGVQNESR